MKPLKIGQTVEIRFNEGADNAFILMGLVLANIDHVCRPLSDMWRVEVTGVGPEQGARFGISGRALYPLET
jgi:hypothetical protein